jgi:lipopolysaccharide export LptBFGC system permease protein LptF
MTASRSTRSTPLRPSPARHRLAVASRALAAIVGGYALAAFCTTALALALRTPREEAALLATLPSFLLYAGAILWAFAARRAWQAWAGILVPTLIAAGITWWLRGGAAS